MATISEALAIAIRHHQAGRLQAAGQIYRQILAAEPDHAEAWHLLGVIAHQSGEHETAVSYVQRAIGLDGNEAAFHNNLGEVYRTLGRVAEAVASFRRALELKPDFAAALNNLGNALDDQGDLDGAAACCRRALELEPDYAQAHNNLGNALNDQGKLDEAAACYGRALELKPDYVQAHNNLGATLKQQGKLDEAVACFRRAVQRKPDYVEAWHNLGVALADQGRPDDAVACYRRVLELKPDHAQACHDLGIALGEQGRLDDAVACYRRALELKPDFAAAHNNLGNAWKDQGKLDDAAASFRRALALKPEFAEAYNNLGVVLEIQGKLDEAVACRRRALELKPDLAEAHNNLGVALKGQGKLDEAVACFRRALELKPDMAEAHANLGSALEEIGDFQGAEASSRAALGHNGRFVLAHYNLAVLLRGKLPPPDLAAQRRLLDEGGLIGAEQFLLSFGLAQVLDARGEYAEAAGHLDRANALQASERRRHGRPYDPKEYEALASQMIGVWTPDLFGRVGGFGLESQLPVFVVGLPRSGTTLVEQILACHSQVFGAGETPLVRDTLAALGPGADLIGALRRLDRQTAQRLASRHLERLGALSPEALRIVDKMPANFLYLGLLATLFPRAKLIHCRRDLRDVAVSCWMTHFNEIPWANEQQHIASRFHEYRRVMEHWRKVLPAPLLEVDYEETVADLEGVARRLVDFCGLAWEPACLDFHRAKRPVSTASAIQVRQPVFKTSVGRWKHYRQSLASLFTLLEEEGIRDS
jgi:tetratricopeptide (TPR) repeat protein